MPAAPFGHARTQRRLLVRFVLASVALAVIGTVLIVQGSTAVGVVLLLLIPADWLVLLLVRGRIARMFGRERST